MGLPNKLGYFGEFGGRFVPETLMVALTELEAGYRSARRDRAFKAELTRLLTTYAGRQTPLYHARRLTENWQGPKVYLKREDLAHTGAHKINNSLGQALLAKKLGKQRVIAETGAGQHGVATATAAALLGLECVVYMGEEDTVRQKPNLLRMELLGAKVIPVTSGTKTLKDATNEAIRDWVTNVHNTHYIIGSTVGPHPYPMMVRDFQSVIGKEARRQILKIENRLPHAIVACVGGGSNAAGMFYAFLNDKKVKLYGAETAGEGLTTGLHAASLTKGRPGILHGSNSLLLQDRHGQVMATHSAAAGLDYPGVGPEHSYLKVSGRVKYLAIRDKEAMKAFMELSETEGIIPALESSFALALAKKLAKKMSKRQILLINLSGRGDKDLANEELQTYIRTNRRQNRKK